MNNSNNEILIIGAGPTGLMLANQLTRFGIDYKILDKKSGPTTESRALVVQSKSMEIYEQLGLSDKIVAEAQPAMGLQFYRNGKFSSEVTLVNPDEKSSPFPKVYIYEQSKNENLLYQNLLSQSINVEWNTDIVSIEKQDDIYLVNLTKNNENITYPCRYLIACDGSKSIVRDFSQITFTGGTYENVFYVADTHAKAHLSSNKLSVFFTFQGFTLLFPMKGENHFRVLGVLPKAFYHKENISFEDILDRIEKDMEMPIDLYNTNWHSTYKLHHKKVSHFSKDNIFFAGDAAHIHSPAGGQGMNTGLQDAYNLAWKLALVKREIAMETLLQTYNEERNPIAEDLLKSTDSLFSMAIKDNFFVGLFRVYIIPFVIPLIMKSDSIRKKMFASISQINIAYKTSSLSKGKAGAVVAGMRLPFFQVIQQNNSTSIYTIVNPFKTFFTVILYNMPDLDFSLFDKDLFSIITLEKNSINDKALQDVGLPFSFIIVLRPDNYIAYINETGDTNEIASFIRQAYSLK